jgi:hypothetical protein
MFFSECLATGTLNSAEDRTDDVAASRGNHALAYKGCQVGQRSPLVRKQVDRFSTNPFGGVSSMKTNTFCHLNVPGCNKADSAKSN